MVGDYEWLLKAPCRRLPYTWWELPDSGGALTSNNFMARKICRTSCPVLGQCFDLAVSDKRQLPVGVMMAGIAWREQRSGKTVPSRRHCAVCSTALPVWERAKQDRCFRHRIGRIRRVS